MLWAGSALLSMGSISWPRVVTFQSVPQQWQRSACLRNNALTCSERKLLDAQSPPVHSSHTALLRRPICGLVVVASGSFVKGSAVARFCWSLITLISTRDAQSNKRGIKVTDTYGDRGTSETLCYTETWKHSSSCRCEGCSGTRQLSPGSVSTLFSTILLKLTLCKGHNPHNPSPLTSSFAVLGRPSDRFPLLWAMYLLFASKFWTKPSVSYHHVLHMG